MANELPSETESSATKEIQAVAPIKQHIVLDKTPVDVIELPLNFTPDVGYDSSKIAVSLNLRLLFQAEVS